MNNFTDCWLPKKLKNITAYNTIVNNNYIKLDAMETPYELENSLRQKWLNELIKVDINRYPLAQNDILIAKIKKFFDIPDKYNILLGNGSDELIQILLTAVDYKDNILSFTPSFVMYQIIAKQLNLNYIAVPLKENFQIDLEKTLQYIKKYQPKIIFIATPNNPTANSFNYKNIKEIIINSVNSLIVIDEAYSIYNGYNLIDMLNYDNVILMRTLSKIGLAGVRLGFLIGNNSLITNLDKIRLPYNINSLTQKSAIFFLDNKTFIEQNIEKIKINKKIMMEKLHNIKSIVVYPSNTNFILFKIKKGCSLDIFNKLKISGILIKHFANNTNLHNFFRVTVGRKTENETFIKTLEKILANS